MTISNQRSRTQPLKGIRLIANELGLSIGTVDRALHNRGGISAVTRARVLEMAKKLNYRPNIAARDLKLNRLYKISINLPEGINSFFDEVRRGIAQASIPFQPRLELQNRANPRQGSHELEPFQAALDAGVNAIIVAPGSPAELLPLMQEAKRRNIAVVCVATDAPTSGRLTAITAHPYTAGAMAAEYLVRCLQKPGIVAAFTGRLTAFSHSERMRGFRSVFAENSGKGIAPIIIESHDQAAEAYTQMHKLLKAEKDIAGVYVSTANSLPILDAMKADGRLGKIPVITTDIFQEIVEYLRNGAVAATIYQRPRRMGSAAIRTLYHYLADNVMPPSSIGLVPQLVIKANVDLMLDGVSSSSREDLDLATDQAWF